MIIIIDRSVVRFVRALGAASEKGERRGREVAAWRGSRGRCKLGESRKCKQEDEELASLEWGRFKNSRASLK